MSKKPREALQTLDEAPPPTRGRRPIDLSSANGVLEELARLYRDARHGRLDVQRATRLGYLLTLCLRAHEVSTLERRVAALEGSGGPELDDPNPEV